MCIRIYFSSARAGSGIGTGSASAGFGFGRGSCRPPRGAVRGAVGCAGACALGLPKGLYTKKRSIRDSILYLHANTEYTQSLSRFKVQFSHIQQRSASKAYIKWPADSCPTASRCSWKCAPSWTSVASLHPLRPLRPLLGLGLGLELGLGLGLGLELGLELG